MKICQEKKIYNLSPGLTITFSLLLFCAVKTNKIKKSLRLQLKSNNIQENHKGLDKADVDNVDLSDNSVDGWTLVK